MNDLELYTIEVKEYIEELESCGEARGGDTKGMNKEELEEELVRRTALRYGTSNEGLPQNKTEFEEIQEVLVINDLLGKAQIMSLAQKIMTLEQAMEIIKNKS